MFNGKEVQHLIMMFGLTEKETGIESPFFHTDTRFYCRLPEVIAYVDLHTEKHTFSIVEACTDLYFLSEEHKNAYEKVYAKEVQAIIKNCEAEIFVNSFLSEVRTKLLDFAKNTTENYKETFAEALKKLSGVFKEKGGNKS